MRLSCLKKNTEEDEKINTNDKDTQTNLKHTKDTKDTQNNKQNNLLIEWKYFLEWHYWCVCV